MFAESQIGAGSIPSVRCAATLKGLPVLEPQKVGGWGAKCESWFFSHWLRDFFMPQFPYL